MAPETGALSTTSNNTSRYTLNADQIHRATTALLRKIQSDQVTKRANAEKQSLLADADEQDTNAAAAIWLVLTTKKHIIDKKRLKPGKIPLPHPYLDANDENLRICLITADPQRKYKDLLAEPSFPLGLAKRVRRVIGISKLKRKYKSYESRRQLLGEYDAFLADDRIITYLPQMLGKTFYQGGSKRPIPISLEGKRQNRDERGNKRQKLSEGGAKVVKDEPKAADVAKQIEKTLGSALVHLAPSTTTAVKVGRSSLEPSQLQGNVENVVEGLVDKYVPQKWSNVRSIHIKGPNTAALPIWLADELWVDNQDVLDEPLPVKEKSNKKKKKRGFLAGAASEALEVIEVPGPDGQMRRLEQPSVKRKSSDDTERLAKPAKKQKSHAERNAGQDAEAKAAERGEMTLRKEALKKQKEAAKAGVNAAMKVKEVLAMDGEGTKAGRKTRLKAAGLT